MEITTLYSSGKLDKDSVTEISRQTAAEGNTVLTQFYSLDAIIAIGYLVSSAYAKKFHIWIEFLPYLICIIRILETYQKHLRESEWKVLPTKAPSRNDSALLQRK